MPGAGTASRPDRSARRSGLASVALARAAGRRGSRYGCGWPSCRCAWQAVRQGLGASLLPCFLGDRDPGLTPPRPAAAGAGRGHLPAGPRGPAGASPGPRGGAGAGPAAAGACRPAGRRGSGGQPVLGHGRVVDIALGVAAVVACPCRTAASSAPVRRRNGRSGLAMNGTP